MDKSSLEEAGEIACANCDEPATMYVEEGDPDLYVVLVECTSCGYEEER